MGDYTGTSGDDVFVGSGGADTMTGLAGNDTYYVDHEGDVVIEATGGGQDRVAAAVSYILTANAEVEQLEATNSTATTPLDLTANDFVNLVIGNNGVNFLRGEGGNDTLIGYGGNDFLIGGSGADLMYGGLGNDTFYVDDIGDRAYENGGEGTDRIATLITYTLDDASEIELLESTNTLDTTAMDLTGSSSANQIIGNAGVNFLYGAGGNDQLVGLNGDDYLIGGTGADLMYGGTGNDTFYVDDIGDRAYELIGEGTDRIATLISYTLDDSSEIELLESTNTLDTNAMDLTGSSSANTIIGNAGVNFLYGAGGNDTLVALGGNDFLIGGTGADLMHGGLGDDTFYVDDIGDQANEFASQGNDRVATSVSFTLSADIETLEAVNSADTGAMNLTGNAGANTITGSAGVNVIDGKGGADVLTGLGGADFFAFTTALGGGNIDTIVGFVAGTDKIRLAGSNGDPFAALASGTLLAGAFVIGSQAQDANDYILYNSGTGALSYDADGNGAGAAVQFATLGTGLALTAADFIVSGAANTPAAVTSGSTASIAENSPASTIVYQAAATDADGDRVTWSLSGTDAGLLTIDAVTGAVRLIASPDFETKSSYSFNVVASDSASATPKAVTLTITDVTDQSTPIINEKTSANGSTGTAQTIDTFAIANNPNLHNDDLPSATIMGNVTDHDDVDFYAVTLQAGQQLILDIDATRHPSDPDLSLDAFLTLYAPNGAFIGDNDDQISFDTGSQPGIASHNTDSQIIFRAAVSGTYYFSVSAFDDGNPLTTNDNSFGFYSLNVSIGPAATAAQLVQEDIEALDSGTMWDHTNLTYGFPTLASQYPQSFEEPDNGFSPFTAAQQAATRLLLQIIGTVTPLTFTELLGSPGTADLRYAMSNEPDVAYAYYPTNEGPNDVGGSAWFNHTSFNNPMQGNYAWMGILHETGHALGLKHGHEFPLAISGDRDSVEYTVMTYRSYPGQDLEDGGGYTNESNGYPQTLMMYDIATLQSIYGANFNFNNGNSVYTWSPTSGAMSINGSPATSPSGNRIFLTVWDGGGTDTYSLANYTSLDTTGTTIDLRPGEWTTIAQTQIANLGEGHHARGNVANALLYQGNTASLIENAIGSQTTDTIIANQAANQLTGNGGIDTFKWMAASDVGTGGLADTITDFVRGTDFIDLSPIDAIPGSGGNDLFSFIGTGAFTNTAGQLRYEVTGGHAHIFADLDGNGVADFEIVVNNVTILATSDFLL